MRTRRFGGKAWLAAVLLLSGLFNAPGANAGPLGSYAGWRLPINLAAAQTPMEAQMLGEQPYSENFRNDIIFNSIQINTFFIRFNLNSF